MLDIVRPADPGYADLRHAYTASGSPAAVVRPRHAGEVAEAIAFARAAGGPLSVRSGGHGFGGASTNTGGTVIDLGHLDGVERVRPGGDLVRVGPGARWGDVAAALHPWGLAISSGDSGDVGVGGLATNGGIGLLGRAHGLTIDHLVSADIVTADGVLHTVDAERDPDLFWAIRGAGANFGVVTSFELRARRVPVVAHATLQYRVVALGSFLRAWGATVEAAPREISAFLYLMGNGPALATVVFAGADATAAQRALTPFLRVAPVLGQRASLVPYAALVAATGAAHRGREGGRVHTGLAVHLDEAVSGGVERMVRAGLGGMLQVRSVGGAVNDVPADATAYAHRHQNFAITGVARGRLAEFDAAWEELRTCLDGLYVGFESSYSPSRIIDAFPGPTLTRLRQIKRRVDPDGVFDRYFPVNAVVPGVDAGVPAVGS